METSGEFPPLSLVKKFLSLHVRRRNLRETILKWIITLPTLRKLKRSGRKPGKNVRIHGKSARYDASGIGLVKKENVSEPGSVDFTWRQKIKRQNLFFKKIGILKWPHHVQRSVGKSLLHQSTCVFSAFLKGIKGPDPISRATFCKSLASRVL